MPDAPTYPEPDRDPESGDPRYVFRPRMMGAEVEYRLTREGLEMRTFARKLVAPYREIRKIRLSYRPQSLSMRRCLAEIWTEKSGKLILTSNSWKSMVEQDQKDGPYLGFLAELHQRLKAARATTEFRRGQPALVYWIGIVLFTGTLLAFAALVVRGLREGAWGAVAMVGALMALFFWQLGQYLARNRPGTYSPDALPAEVLPPVPKPATT